MGVSNKSISTKLSYIFLLLLLFDNLILSSQSRLNNVDVKDLSPVDIKDLQEEILDKRRFSDSSVILLKVNTKDGRFVTGLSGVKPGIELFMRNSRSLLDECDEISLIEVSEFDSKSDLCFSLVLDYSGSMAGIYGIMQLAAMSFIEAMDGAQFTRVNFDQNIDVVNQLPTANPLAVNLDDYSKYGGSTALFGALVESAKTISSVDKNRFIIVFTDGIENASGISTNMVVSYLQQLQIPVYGISFGVSPEIQRLREICYYTNGAFYHIQSFEELKQKFEELRDNQFGSYYKIVSKCNDEFDRLILKDQHGGEHEVVTQAPIRKPPVFDDPVWFRTYHFDVGEYKLRKEDMADLKSTADQVIRYLMDNPQDTIMIVGHASPEGGEKLNWLLSYKRAFEIEQLIKSYLLDKYLNDVDILYALKRIEIDYYGDSQPLYPSTSYFNRDNRRVHILVR